MGSTNIVEVWPVNFNGERTTKTPIASFLITDGSEAGGAWGPVSAKSGQRYEFALVKPAAKTLHVYMEPFVRSDYDIRLLGSIPIEEETGRRHSSRRTRPRSARESRSSSPRVVPPGS